MLYLRATPSRSRATPAREPSRFIACSEGGRSRPAVVLHQRVRGHPHAEAAREVDVGLEPLDPRRVLELRGAHAAVARGSVAHDDELHVDRGGLRDGEPEDLG